MSVPFHCGHFRKFSQQQGTQPCSTVHDYKVFGSEAANKQPPNTARRFCCAATHLPHVLTWVLPSQSPSVQKSGGSHSSLPYPNSALSTQGHGNRVEVATAARLYIRSGHPSATPCSSIWLHRSLQSRAQIVHIATLCTVVSAASQLYAWGPHKPLVSTSSTVTVPALVTWSESH